MISDKNLELLRIFSDWANKGGIGFHTCDRERWYKFVISTYRDDEILPCDYLRELLSNNGWKNFRNKVDELVLIYEEDIMVLQANDKL